MDKIDLCSTEDVIEFYGKPVFDKALKKTVDRQFQNHTIDHYWDYRDGKNMEVDVYAWVQETIENKKKNANGFVDFGTYLIQNGKLDDLYQYLIDEASKEVLVPFIKTLDPNWPDNIIFPMTGYDIWECMAEQGIEPDIDYNFDMLYKNIGGLCCNIKLQTGREQNLDFCSIPRLHYQMDEEGFSGFRDDTFVKNNSAVWLIKQQGYALKDIVCQTESVKDSPFCKSLHEALLEAWTPTSNIQILVNLSIDELESIFKSANDETLKVNKEAYFAIVDNWNGTLSEFNIEKPVFMSKQMIYDIDIEDGIKSNHYWTPDQICGFVRNMVWKENCISLTKNKPFVMPDITNDVTEYNIMASQY